MERKTGITKQKQISSRLTVELVLRNNILEIKSITHWEHFSLRNAQVRNMITNNLPNHLDK